MVSTPEVSLPTPAAPPIQEPAIAHPVTEPGASPAVHVQRHTDSSPRTKTGATPVVRPIPPRPLDSGQKLPPIAHPHLNGTPSPRTEERPPSKPDTKHAPGKRPVQRQPPQPPAPQPPPRTGEQKDDGKALDLEELARRLLDPLGRLLRAELREGRERAGRLHDRHR